MYKKRKVKLITKITINSIYNDSKNDISMKFWYKIFSKDFLTSFLKDKYIPFKLKNKTLNNSLISDIKFTLSKIDKLKEDINLIEKDSVKINDVFFSYVLFEKILGYYSDYYSDSFIKLSLLLGLEFSYNSFNETDFVLDEIEKSFLNDDNKFIQDLVLPLYETVLEEDTLYTLKIFWPNEIILALIFGKFVKKNTKNSKLILDVSEANEQLDYTKWSLLVKNNYKFLSNYLDFFVLYRDFGDSGSKIYEYLNGDNNIKFSNLISIEKESFNEYPFNKDHISSNIEKFFKTTFTTENVFKLFGKKTLYARMFPYKCYWSKCNFCAINSQNAITYDNTFGYDIFINKWISFIKENNIYQIIFADEALPPTQILKFAKKIIENDINIIYQFRTRFDKFYTREVCEILFKSGARYCGIGLESGSERINEEIGNKGEKHISLKDKLNIIKNFDNSGVSFHNYSIMGFPTEKENETMLTYKFLSKNIEKRNFYTCTPNIFGLMKGSYIFNNLDKYGIVIDEKYLKSLLTLSFEFNYSNGEKRNLKLYHELAEKLHKEQFLPWLIGNDNISGRGFWNYIDRSNYFYKTKMIYRKSPFFSFRDINKEVLKKESDEILNSYFEVSKYIQELDLEGEKKYFYEHINMVEFWLHNSLKDFFENYKKTLTLQENIHSQEINLPYETIIFFLENRILLDAKKV